MEKLTYNDRPNSLEEARKRASELAEYVESITGVKWEIDAHENLGFHYKISHGSITIHNDWYPNGTKYSIYCSGPSKYIGTGHGELNVIYVNSLEELPRALTNAIRDIFKVIDRWDKVIMDLSGLKQAREIIEERKRF